jgi:septum formation protein
MSAAAPRLVLASASPRRVELLGLLWPDFLTEPAAIDESRRDEESPADHVERLAREKATTVWHRHDAGTVVVVGADTEVVIDGGVLGKPTDADDAARMLRLLAGRRHEVITGVAVVDTAGTTRSFVDRTGVTVVPLRDDDVAAYVETGEPLDKAGGYAIQGRGGRFVAAVDGNVHNVVGLPTARLAPILAHAMGQAAG